MKRALVIVSFGTSVEKARENITAMEEAAKRAVPDADFFRAFTSPTIRRVLDKKGETVPSLDECLRDLLREGYTDVIVQPTHFLFGIEYDKMKATVDAYRTQFKSLLFGTPLLASQRDLEWIVTYVSESYAKQDGQAVVLFGHGTHHFANMTYPALQTVFRIQGRPDVLVGTVEGWPTLDDIRAELGGCSSVLFVPLMLVNGDHVMNDLAGTQEDSWKSILEQDGYDVYVADQGMGIEPQIQALLVTHLLELIGD